MQLTFVEDSSHTTCKSTAISDVSRGTLLRPENYFIIIIDKRINIGLQFNKPADSLIFMKVLAYQR